MSRVLLFLALPLTTALPAGCADLTPEGCPDGQTRVAGLCTEPGPGGSGGGFDDPEPQEKGLRLGCTNNLTSDASADLVWELTVDPGPIVGGEAFAAVFDARAVFNEAFLDVAQTTVPGGFNRAEVVELRATVHVREGVSPDTTDAVLDHQLITRTCAYDEDGNTGAGAGPFAQCSQQDDNPDGSNRGCTGLGDIPTPENFCGQFINIPTSDDCAPGGACDELGKLASQCEVNGFCVTGSVHVSLDGERGDYIAAAEGVVLFGFDDQSTGAEIDQTDGPNDGAWILPPAIFDEPTGPNGLRVRVGGIEVAVECTMGIDCRGPGVTECRDDLSGPTPDQLLIRFPIQVR